MLSLCNMLIVNFVPLPNFGEINIDKNFSFIYLILLFVCLVLLAPVNVTTPELQSTDPTLLSPGSPSPVSSSSREEDDLRATSGSCRLSPPRARAAPQLQRDSCLETCGGGNTPPAITRCWLHIVQYTAPCCDLKYAFHFD